MKATNYSWNTHEQNLYQKGLINLPSPYKIKIVDDPDQRLALEQLLEQLPHAYLAKWSMLIAENFTDLITIDDEKVKAAIIKESSLVFQDRVTGLATAHQLRQVGFLTNSLAKRSLNDLSKFAARVYAQAIATGHMRGHAMVASDYAIKVRNLQHSQDLKAASEERQRQIDRATELLTTYRADL